MSPHTGAGRAAGGRRPSRGRPFDPGAVSESRIPHTEPGGVDLQRRVPARHRAVLQLHPRSPRSGRRRRAAWRAPRSRSARGRRCPIRRRAGTSARSPARITRRRTEQRSGVAIAHWQVSKEKPSGSALHVVPAGAVGRRRRRGGRRFRCPQGAHHEARDGGEPRGGAALRGVAGLRAAGGRVAEGDEDARRRAGLRAGLAGPAAEDGGAARFVCGAARGAARRSWCRPGGPSRRRRCPRQRERGDFEASVEASSEPEVPAAPTGVPVARALRRRRPGAAKSCRSLQPEKIEQAVDPNSAIRSGRSLKQMRGTQLSVAGLGRGTEPLDLEVALLQNLPSEYPPQESCSPPPRPRRDGRS